MKKVMLYLSFAASAWAQCAAPYGFQRSITVNSGQVTGTQTNFPMLVLNPTASLKTVANGGHVQNANGYDIVFVDAGGSPLAFELVGHGTANATYSATTGNVEFWVNVGSMATGSTVYMCYGAASVTSYQGNDSATWNSAYKGVWHGGTASSATANDSTGNSNNGTLFGSAATAGKIGGGYSFNGTSDYIALPGGTTDFSTAFTLGLWVNASALTASNAIFRRQLNSANFALLVFTGTGGGINVGVKLAGAQNFASSTNSITTGGWHYISVSIDATTNATIVVDSTVSPGTLANRNNLGSVKAGWGSEDSFWGSIQGAEDEIHISNTVRSTNWIAAEYNNQSNPSAFYSVGSESSTTGTSMTIAPTAIPNGHAGNITLTLTGTGTNWSNGSTVFAVAGVSNVTKVSQNVTSATTATLVVTTGAGTGSLNIAETVTGTASRSVTVAVPSFSIDVVRGNLNSVQSLSLTGTNTVWTQEATGRFTVTGGTGASIGTPAITSDTAGTVALTVGTLAGTLSITDTSTGKTVTFAAGGAAGPSGCAMVLVQ